MEDFLFPIKNTSYTLKIINFHRHFFHPALPFLETYAEKESSKAALKSVGLFEGNNVLKEWVSNRVAAIRCQQPCPHPYRLPTIW